MWNVLYEVNLLSITLLAKETIKWGQILACRLINCPADKALRSRSHGVLTVSTSAREKMEDDKHENWRFSLATKISCWGGTVALIFLRGGTVTVNVWSAVLFNRLQKTITWQPSSSKVKAVPSEIYFCGLQWHLKVANNWVKYWCTFYKVMTILPQPVCHIRGYPNWGRQDREDICTVLIAKIVEKR